MRNLLTLAVLAVLLAVPSVQAAVTEELVLDAGGGVTATITVTTGSVLNCVGTLGGCLGLTSQTITFGDHGELHVGGTIGGFRVSVTGNGQDNSTLPTLQTFNQIDAQSISGAGTLISRFTVLDYTTLADNFKIAVSGVDDTQINDSKTSFAAYVSGTNANPATDLIGQFLTLTGDSFNTSGTFASPIAGDSTGSLTSLVTLAFSGAGQLQANLTISNVAVPEPASIFLLGTAVLGLATLVRKRVVRQ